MASNNVDVKVVLLGMHSVGKSCLVERYLHGRFKDSSVATVGAAFGAKKIVANNNQTIVLGIWDTAGSERYESMTRVYYRGAQAALVCYDLLSAQSWKKVQFWISELREHEPDCMLYLVGTKLDLVEAGDRREVDAATVRLFAESIGARTFETSALSGTGVAVAFQAIADDWVRSGRSQRTDADNPVQLSGGGGGGGGGGGSSSASGGADAQRCQC